MVDNGENGSVQGRVTRTASEPQRAKRGDYRFRGLELSDAQDGPKTFLIAPDAMQDFGRQDLYEFPLLCWEGSEVAGYGLEVNNRLADGTSIYAVKPDSDLVLEPRRLVSVTEAVEAAFCIRSVDIRNRVGPSEPFWMAKGKLIHDLFHHLVTTRGDTSRENFNRAFRKARPGFMASLPGSKVSVDEQAFREEAWRHFRNLGQWIEQNDVVGSAVAVEIDGMSTRWGLKGRADALFAPAGRETILELKSGKVSADEHLFQLYAYCLLFENARGLRPDGRLLYSDSGRSEGMRSFHRWSLIQGRNRVVSLNRMYTLPRLIESADGDCPRRKRCFNRADCIKFHGSASPRKEPFLQGARKEFYDRWFRMLSLELWEAEGQFARVLDPGSLGERLAEGVTTPLLGLAFKDGPATPHETSGDSGRLPGHAVLTVEGSSIDASPGDLIILHQGDPARQDALRARVTARDRGTIHVKIVGGGRAIGESPRGARSEDRSDGEAPWYVDTMPFIRARETARRALHRFLCQAHPSVVRLLVEKDDQPREHESANRHEPHPLPASHASAPDSAARSVEFEPAEPDSPADLDDLCFAEGLDAELNEDQESAVKAALDCDTYHLIHGPPGTGKTRVLARLIRICLDRGERVLVACPTNVALDRLLIALIDLGATDMLRIGGRSAVTSELQKVLERLRNIPVLLEDLCRSRISFSEFRTKVAGTSLIGATAYQCASHPLFIRERFDRVVIDEAGQLDEPTCLGPLALAPKFVLGGDHLQLPPVVRRIAGDESALADLEQSLFERLFSSSPSSRISRLRMQYRMNSEIQEIPSRLFYDGTLFPSPEAAHRKMSMDIGFSDDPAMLRILDPNLSVIFVNIEGPDSGKARPEEARFAAEVVRNLLAAGIPAGEIGLITPYRVQQALIHEFLAEERTAVTVDTVDRFQGGEREVIILSLARSDGVTSFLADRKRLNVSLSRARSKLILLGHGPVLESHPLFQSLLSGLERVSIPAEK
jgi:DNA replication ATP-dependent helicase Dna2